MNYNFLPSLQYMAAARIASRLNYHPEIVRMTDEEETLPVFTSIYDSDRLNMWKEIGKKASELLNPFLPPAKQMIIQPSRFLRAMDYEFRFWINDHFFYYDVDDKILKSCVYWKTDGAIDRNETAKAIVRNENIDLKSRFVMACTYFLEDDIMFLWQKIRDSWKGISRYGTNSSVRFWKKMLNDETVKSWKQHVNEFFEGNIIMNCDSRIRLSCFFDFLCRNNQKFLLSYDPTKLHFDDFRLCLYKLGERERVEALKSNPENALFHCLIWPFQGLFKEMAIFLVNKMDIHHFEYVFSLLIDFILHEFENYDYKDLLEEFWNLTPAAIKERIKKNKQLMKQIKIVQKYDKTKQSECLGEILNRYLSRNLPE